MAWVFTPDRPIYLQLQEQIKLAIVSGAYKPGEQFPAVRDLAVEAAVNPNTLQRALSELEREGLLYSQRTSGRFVTEDKSLIAKGRNEFAVELIGTFFGKMTALGYSREETMTLLNGRK